MVRLFPGVKQHSLAYPLFSDCFKSQDRRFRLSPSPYVSPHCFASPCLSGTRLGFWLLVLVLVCLWAKGLPWQCSMWNGPGDGGRDGSPDASSTGLERSPSRSMARRWAALAVG